MSGDGTVPTSAARTVPSAAELRTLLRDKSNWGRWGLDDQLGTTNLITEEKVARAAQLVRRGRSISLSRPMATAPGPGNSHPAQHYMKSHTNGRGGSSKASPDDVGGYAADYIGLYFHGVTTTHLDAISHVWDEDGKMYNGRDPHIEVGFDGVTFGGVEQWSSGLITRGVMLDVPRHRKAPYVMHDEPVHGWELDDILAGRGIELEPGDAVCVCSGRESWQADHPNEPYGRYPFDACGQGLYNKPGLHASCLEFLRRHDVGILVWDMLDHTPFDYDLPWSVHGALHAFGLPLLDNALLEPLARTCENEGRDDFMFMVSPLVVSGGTGSPVNPLALF
jgi:kynurenine formamidase